MSARDVPAASPSPVGGQLSFLDIDDPFNLRAKSTAACRDDAPIPRTKAAIRSEEAERAQAEEGGVQPLAHRAENTVHSQRASLPSRAAVSAVLSGGSCHDKENSAVVAVSGERTRSRSARQRTKTRVDRAPPISDRAKGSIGAHRVSAVSADSGVEPSSVASLASTAAQQRPHIAPLLNDAVLCGLSSKVWTECVASVTSIREAAEAARGADRGDIVRAGLLVLCDTPGLSCSNQAVWKAVSEACHALLLAAPLTLPVSFVRLVVPCLLSKLTDKRCHGPASVLLLQFAESSSARAVQRCVTASVDEQSKNMRLVEHAILFASSLVSSFSLSALCVPPLLSLASSHSTHPQQAIRAAVCCLLSAVYEQLTPSFRSPLLSAVAPLLHSSLTAALDEVDSGRTNGQLQRCEVQRRGRGEESELMPLSLDTLFPRVELCSALDSSVLGDMRDRQWKVRQLAIQQLTATLDRLQHRVTLRDGSALIAALVPLLSDSNKLLAAQAMAVLRQLICDVGDGMARWRDKLIPSVLAGMVDAKKAVREQAVGALREWASRMGVASIVRVLARAMESANSSGRIELIGLLLAHRTEEAEWSEVIPATLDCLCDKSGEVRTGADRLTEALIAHCGYHAVNTALHRLKDAYVLQAAPSVDRHRFAKKEKEASDAGHTNQRTTSAHSTQLSSNDSGRLHSLHPHEHRLHHSGSGHSASQKAEDESERAARASSGKRKLLRDVAGSQRKELQQTQTQQSHSQCEDGATGSSRLAVPGGAESGDSDCHPFLTRVDVAAKQRRLLRDGKRLQNGSFREWSSEERDETAHTLSALVSPTLHAHMHSADFTRLLHAVHFFSEQLSVQPVAVHAIADVLLRWASALMGEASPKLLMAILAFLSSLLASYHTHHQLLSEAEMHNVLPFIIERLMGHNVQRVRKDATALLLHINQRALFSRAKLIAALLQALDSKNKRVVAESCECVGQLWGGGGDSFHSAASSDVPLAVWTEMKRGLPQLALLLSSACDSTVRMHALSAIVAAYSAIGEQLWVVLSGHTGRPLPEKALSMIEERVKRTRMDASAAASQPHAGSTDDSCITPPCSTTSLTLTPLAVARSAAVQRTPVNNAASQHVGSPVSAARDTTGRKQSGAPTLSALNSSLASLEAMHHTLAAQETSSVPASPAPAQTAPVTAAAAHLASLVQAVSIGGELEQVEALVSLSVAVEQPLTRHLLVEHAGCVMAAVARTLRSEAATAADRRFIVRLSRQLCASRDCVESVRADLCSDFCHALLASTAAELQSGRAAESTREDANYCVQAVLECRSSTDQLTLLASSMLSSLTSSSPYLCSLLAPFLLRWSAAQRARSECAAVDVSSLLCWLHRLLSAVRSCDACERCVLECVDQLLLAAYDCSGGEQRLLALLSGYPTDSPLITRMHAHRQQSMAPTQDSSLHSQTTPTLTRQLQSTEAATVAANITAAGLASPAASVRLDQLLDQARLADGSSASFTPPAVAASGSSSAAPSYVDRFHALQQRLRQQGSQSSAIHHTADFLAPHTAHATVNQSAPPARRGTTGTHSNSTSSVSAILRDTAVGHTAAAATPSNASLFHDHSHSTSATSAAAVAISRSATFEAMRRRMQAKHDAAAHTTCHTGAAEDANLSLSALLASSPPALSLPLPQFAPAPPTASGAAVPYPSDAVSVMSASAVGSVGVVGAVSGSSSAVSALRARLAAIHHANAASRMSPPATVVSSSLH